MPLVGVDQPAVRAPHLQADQAVLVEQLGHVGVHVGALRCGEDALAEVGGVDVSMCHQGGNDLGGVDRTTLSTALDLALQPVQGQSGRGADQEEYERERDP